MASINKYDGNYHLKIKGIGWINFGISDSGSIAWPDALSLTTSGPNSVITNYVPDDGRGRSFKINPAVIDSRLYFLPIHKYKKWLYKKVTNIESTDTPNSSLPELHICTSRGKKSLIYPLPWPVPHRTFMHFGIFPPTSI